MYGIPLHEIAYDQQELSLNLIHESFRPTSNYTLHHGYNHPKFGYNRLDSLQYFQLNQFRMEEVDLTKSIDFVFGYTVITKDRDSMFDEVKSIVSNFKNYNLYVHDKVNGTSNFLSRELYLEKIAKARYTLIIPPYDKESVSIYRILESIELDCLPLFHKDVNYKLIEDSFGVDLSRLILKDNSFEPFTEAERCDIITHLKQKMLVVEKGFV